MTNITDQENGKVDFKAIQDKWQKKWEDAKLFEVKNDSKKKKFYCLEMFPYPSGSGLHMGHAFVYTIGDVFARFKTLNGFNVLHPMGYDSLGLPAENAAIKEGTHPKEYTESSIKNFIKQQKSLGITYDWSRMLNTSDSNYYKWDQWIFLKLFEKGLAYKKASSVNWCPKCNTVLANEQVHNGKCWRHEDTNVEVKNLSQWFFKITDYAEELNDFSKLGEWPELVVKLQKNWIGKSFGTEVIFNVNGEDWPVFTTRPDTLFGVTFLVISAQHSRLMEITTDEQKSEVEAFTKKLHSVSEEEIDQLDKEGVFTGAYAEHPLTGEKVPIYAGNFVIAEYGFGMVMAVPTHDQRDFEFAKKYGIPMKVVINPDSFDLDVKKMTRAYTDDGTLINSGEFDGSNNRDAINEITKALEKKKKGKKTTNFRLRDWLISRQRYWGTPIPIIYCDKCGEVPVPERDLPVELPHDVKFGKGNPLATSDKFLNAKCPKCGGEGKRESDTMDTFVNSSWYYLRYADPNNDSEIFDKDKANYWSPIDMYIGGKEHACMHLIYVRFYTKFLRDIGLLKFDEPAIKMFNQGMLHGEDGNKMSKSLGNVINPLEIVEKDGADALRLFLVSVASSDSDFNWSATGLQGSCKLLNRIVSYFDSVKVGKSSERTESRLNKTVKEVTSDIQNLKYNIATIKIRQLFESFSEEESKEVLESFLKILNPFCPHVTEELWEKIGNKAFISNASWPKVDESKINKKFEIQDRLTEEVKLDIGNVLKLAKIEKPSKIILFVSPKWKYELYDLLKNKLKETKNPKDIIHKIMESDLKEHSKDIMKMIPKIIKTGVVPNHLSLKDEVQLLEGMKKGLSDAFGASVEVVKAEDSDNPKAGNAMPSKPAILVE